MKISAPVLICSAVLPTLVCFGNAAFADSDSDFRRASILRRDKHYAEAIPIYNKVIPTNVNVYVAMVGKAYCKYALGDIDGALKDCDTASDHDPGRPDAYRLAARLYLDKKQYKEAIKQADEALDLRWNFEDCLKIKAMALFGDRQFDKSLVFFANAIKYNPKDASLYFLRGLVYEKMADYVPAQKDFETALVADPKNNEVRLKLARIDLRSGRIVQAEKKATEAIAIDPKCSDAYVVRATAISMLNKFDRAINDAAQAVKLDPKNPHGYALLGEFEYRNKNYDAAINDLKHCNQMDPDLSHGKVHQLLSRVYKQKGLLKESEAERAEAQKRGYPDID